MKGFRFTWELVFLKNLKKVLLEEVKNQKYSSLGEFLDMMGPAFALTSNSSVDLMFDDFDEIREHPHADNFLLSLDQIIQGAFGKSVKEMLKYEHKFEDVDKTKLDKYIKSSEYCQDKMKELDLFQAIANMMKEMDPNFNATAEGHLFGFVGLKYELSGAGYGDLALLLYNCITCSPRDRCVRLITSDFTDAQESVKN